LRSHPDPTEKDDILTARNCIDIIGFMLRGHLPDTNHEATCPFVDTLIATFDWTGGLQEHAAWRLFYICEGNEIAQQKLRLHGPKMCDCLRKASEDLHIRAFALLCCMVGGIGDLMELLTTLLDYPKSVDALFQVVYERIDHPMDILAPCVIKCYAHYKSRWSERRAAICSKAFCVLGRIVEWTEDPRVATECLNTLKEGTDPTVEADCRFVAYGTLARLASKYPEQCTVSMDLNVMKGKMLTEGLLLVGQLHGPAQIVSFLEESRNCADFEMRFLSCCYAWWAMEYECDTSLRGAADAILTLITKILEELPEQSEVRHRDVPWYAATVLATVVAYCSIPFENGLVRMMQCVRNISPSPDHAASFTCAIVKCIERQEVAVVLRKLELQTLFAQWVRENVDNLSLLSDVLLALGLVSQKAEPILQAMEAFDQLAVQCGGCKALVEMYRYQYPFTKAECEFAIKCILRARNLEACAGNIAFHTHASAAHGFFTSLLFQSV